MHRRRRRADPRRALLLLGGEGGARRLVARLAFLQGRGDCDRQRLRLLERVELAAQLGGAGARRQPSLGLLDGGVTSRHVHPALCLLRQLLIQRLPQRRNFRRQPSLPRLPLRAVGHVMPRLVRDGGAHRLLLCRRLRAQRRPPRLLLAKRLLLLLDRPLLRRQPRLLLLVRLARQRTPRRKARAALLGERRPCRLLAPD
mmetsp:Transcript_39129/g.126525  ORF Transcript_39129/g.126525 Transcript_39129/m.126525 type:complete len:200 (-) Transcript_39129:1025-1624(-)